MRTGIQFSGGGTDARDEVSHEVVSWSDCVPVHNGGGKTFGRAFMN